MNGKQYTYLANLSPIMGTLAIGLAITFFLFGGLNSCSSEEQAKMDAWRATPQVSLKAVEGLDNGTPVVVVGNVTTGETLRGGNTWAWYLVQVEDTYESCSTDSKGNRSCTWHTDWDFVNENYPPFKLELDGKVNVLAGYKVYGKQQVQRIGDFRITGVQQNIGVTVIGYAMNGSIQPEWVCGGADVEGCFSAADRSTGIKVFAWFFAIVGVAVTLFACVWVSRLRF